MTYILGLDLGTSSIKGLLMDREGTIVAIESEEYPLYHPYPGYSEQDPSDWVKGAKGVIQKILEKFPEAAESIEAVSFSGQMHSLILLDAQDDVLRKAILWNDVRTTKQCETIMDRFGDEVLRINKNRALEGFTLPKMLWIQENEPEIWGKVASFLLPKDYLAFWLTGNKTMEYSDAAGTLLLDIKEKNWSREVLETFNVPATICPKLTTSTGFVGNIQEEVAKELGLKNTVPVFAGAADNAAAAVGAGIMTEDKAMASIGTSGVFLSYEENADKDFGGNLHYFNHAAENAYYTMGVTLAAGHSLTWFKNTFAEEDDYQTLLNGIDQVPVGSNGLLFTPYIVGERSPHIDSQVRGSFVGVDTSHTKKDFTRAVLEGVTFSLKDSQELLKEHANKTFETIVSVGGGAQNEEWLQIQADIFGAKVITLEIEQGPAMGAVMIAAVGAGWFPDLKSCAEVFVRYQKEILPKEENVKKYEQLYSIYREIYPATKELTHKLQQFR